MGVGGERQRERERERERERKRDRETERQRDGDREIDTHTQRENPRIPRRDSRKARWRGSRGSAYPPSTSVADKGRRPHKTVSYYCCQAQKIVAEGRQGEAPAWYLRPDAAH